MGPQSYLLKAYEELWVKELSEDVENILKWALGIYSLTPRLYQVINKFQMRITRAKRKK